MKKTLLACILCLIIGALMAQEAQKTGFVPNRGFEINLGIFTPLQQEIGYGLLLKYSFPLLHANNGVVRQALRLNSAYRNKSQEKSSIIIYNDRIETTNLIYNPEQIECSIGYELQKVKRRWRWTAGVDIRYANDKGNGIRSKTTVVSNGALTITEMSPFTRVEREVGNIVFGGVGYYLTPYLSLGTEWGLSFMNRKYTDNFIGRPINTYTYNAFEYKFPRILYLGYHF